MEFKEIENEIRKVNEKLDNLASNKELSDKEKILARYTKMIEEVGELSEQILGSMNLQRSEKNISGENLGKEFADVFNTFMILAVTMDVDVEEEFKKKLEIIHERL